MHFLPSTLSVISYWSHQFGRVSHIFLWPYVLTYIVHQFMKRYAFSLLNACSSIIKAGNEVISAEDVSPNLQKKFLSFVPLARKYTGKLRLQLMTSKRCDISIIDGIIWKKIIRSEEDFFLDFTFASLKNISHIVGIIFGQWHKKKRRTMLIEMRARRSSRWWRNLWPKCENTLLCYNMNVTCSAKADWAWREPPVGDYV